jgi:Mg2+-importing ATPase
MIGNFGNFFALSTLYLLSGASLPLLPIQLILTNLFTDIPLIAISTDNVEISELQRPSKYNTHALMFISIFLGTFTAMFEIMFYTLVKRQPANIEQTALFLFLNLSGLIVILSVRNKGHFWKATKISNQLKIALLSMTTISLGVLYITVTRHLFSLTAIPLKILGLTVASTIIYLMVLDLVKVWFYQSKLGSNY